MENNGLEIYFENKRTHLIPNIRDPYNISPLNPKIVIIVFLPFFPFPKNIYIYLCKLF